FNCNKVLIDVQKLNVYHYESGKMESHQPERSPQQQAVAEALRKAVTNFFERAEQFEQSDGKPPHEDHEGQKLFVEIIRLLEQSGVDMQKWEALEQNQVWVLEIIAEGADPIMAIEASYYELARPDNQN